MSRESDRQLDPHHKDILRTVAQALTEIQYGSIVITIHQGEVVGIETSTKVRPKAPTREASP
jgi:hypothetical protein